MWILCVSDIHLLSPDVESGALFPRLVWYSVGGQAFYHASRIRIRMRYLETLANLSESGFAWDLVVGLGDITGGWQEEGMVHHSLIPIAREVVEDLGRFAPHLRFVAGNHDTGYGRKGGINTLSLKIWEEMFGNLWWTRQTGEVLLCGIAASLAEAAAQFPKYASMQEDCIRDALNEHRGNPWLLFTHSPFGLGKVGRIIEEHKETLLGCVFGDFHHLRAGRWATRFLQNRKGIFCPSVAPLWSPGGGFLQLFVNTKSGTLRHYTGQVPVVSGRWPRIDSPPHCAAWMAGIPVGLR